MQLNQSIVLCGFMAVGKTSVGHLLSETLNVPFIDTDAYLVAKTKMSIPEIFQKGGEGYFRDLEHEVTKEVVLLPPSIVSTGGGMLTFDRNGEILKDRSTIVCITRDFDAIYATLKSDANRPLVHQKTKEEIQAMYLARISKYKKYANFFVSNNSTVLECVQKIIDLISL